MLHKLKAKARDALPRRHQVPIKYWYGRLRGDIEPEMKLLPRLVGSGDHVVDIGGNRGTYAYRLAGLGALSSGEGRAALHIPVDSSGVEHDASASLDAMSQPGLRDVEVPLRSLDSYGFDDVGFIKIDVEGHESRVLSGAVGTIAASRPAMLIEIEQRHNRLPIRDIFRSVEEQGYRGFFLLDGRLRPLEDFDPDVHQRPEALGLGGDEYHNNFLFLASARLAQGGYAGLPGISGRR